MSEALRMGTFQFSLKKSGGMRTPETARPSARSLLGVAKTPPPAIRPKPDIRAGENFNYLKLNAEKLVQKPACAKTDLQTANSKLKNSAEQIRILETKLHYVSNTNTKLKLKQKEDAKLWKGLDSKLSSTKTFCDQLTDTLQQLVIQVEEAEGGKKVLEEKMLERMKSFEELMLKVNLLSSSLDNAEATIKKRERELMEISIEKEKLEESYDAEIAKTNLLTVKKDNIEKRLQDTVEEHTRVLENLQTQFQGVQRELALKENACTSMQAIQSKLETEKAQLEFQIEEHTRALENLQTQFQGIQRELALKENACASMQAIQSKLETEKAQLEFQIEEYTSVLENIQTQFQGVQSELDLKENACTSMQAIQSNLETEKAQLKIQIEENTRLLENLQAQFQGVQSELALKENTCTSMQVIQSKLETDKAQLEIQMEEYERKLLTSESEKDALKGEILELSNKIIELEKISVLASNNVDKLLLALDKSTELAQREKMLANQKAQLEFGRLNSQFEDAIFTNASLQSQIQELRDQNMELQQSLALTAKLSAEKEVEAKAELHSTQQKMDQAIDKTGELEEIISKLQENIAGLSHTINEVQKDKEGLQLIISDLKTENQNGYDNAQVMLQQKGEEIESLLQKAAEYNLTINVREDEVNQLRQESINKAQLILQLQEKQEALEEQHAQVRAQVLAAEHTVAEIRRQCELQLEAKQVELSRHLKEISQRNDQEINDIRRRCEAETRECIMREKEKEKRKADRMLQEEKQNSEQRMEKAQEDASHSLQEARKEQESLVKRLREEHREEKQMYQDRYTREMKKKQEEFEKDLDEQHTKLMRDAEVKVKYLQIKHQEEVQKLQEEQNKQLQQAEEKRALLELQIKIMKEKLQEESQRKEDDLAANLNKEHSSSSTKVGTTDYNQEKQVSLVRHANVDKSLMPLDDIRPKSEKGKTESFVPFPKHSKKVTQHEYEVATSDGTKTITKRKRTRSTVMFEDAPADVDRNPKKVNGGRKQRKKSKSSHPCPSTMGDLFGGGSLDPYTDDPYAFG